MQQRVTGWVTETDPVGSAPKVLQEPEKASVAEYRMLWTAIGLPGVQTVSVAALASTVPVQLFDANTSIVPVQLVPVGVSHAQSVQFRVSSTPR